MFEARRALDDGATELDMVLKIGALKSGRDQDVEDDIRAVVEVAHAAGAIVKVIFENAYLTDDEKIRACRLTEAAGGDFVKTSTGFAPSGATHDDLRLMRANTSPHIRVKAAGGVRTLDALLAVMDLGVTRIGATATETIILDFRARKAGEGAGVGAPRSRPAATDARGRGGAGAGDRRRPPPPRARGCAPPPTCWSRVTTTQAAAIETASQLVRRRDRRGRPRPPVRHRALADARSRRCSRATARTPGSTRSSSCR